MDYLTSYHSPPPACPICTAEESEDYCWYRTVPIGPHLWLCTLCGTEFASPDSDEEDSSILALQGSPWVRLPSDSFIG